MPSRAEIARINGQRGGRPKGTPNKATAELRGYAQKYTKEALEMFVKIMRTGESEQARIAAGKELLDRGYGRPAQSVTGLDGGPILTRVIHDEHAD